MKAVSVQKFGGPEGLEVVDIPDPRPARGQVLIAVEAIGVGFQDAMIRSGNLAAMGFREGHILGGEIGGTVTEVGEGVDEAWLGSRVWAFTGLGGGYAEFAVASAETLVPIPETLSPVEAVTIGSAGVVAHFALRHAQFARGQSVMVRGASGSIGIMLVQVAALGGARSIAVTTSSAERGARLRALGATQVLDRSGQGGAGASSSFDIIIDIVGGPDMASFFSRLSPNGRIVMVGAVGGFPPDDFAKAMIPRFQSSLSFATFSANTVPEPDRRAVTHDLFLAASRGELKVVVHEVLPLEQAVVAHEKLDKSEAFGRLLLAPSRP